MLRHSISYKHWYIGRHSLGGALAVSCAADHADGWPDSFFWQPIRLRIFPLDFIEYKELEEVFRESDLISLHCPLTIDNYHMINAKTISLMKDQVVLVNTSRGELVDMDDLIAGIRAHKFHGVGLDVYEEESGNVFENREADIMEHSVTARLLSFPNVIVTSHQAFFTEEAMEAIGHTTLENALGYEKGEIPTGTQV